MSGNRTKLQGGGFGQGGVLASFACFVACRCSLQACKTREGRRKGLDQSGRDVEVVGISAKEREEQGGPATRVVWRKREKR